MKQTGSTGDAWWIYKVVTASDVQAGTVSVHYYNPSPNSYTVFDFAGATGGIGDFGQGGLVSGTTATVSTDSTPIAGDVVVFFAGDWYSTSESVTFTGANQVSDTSTVSVEAAAYKDVTASGVQSATVTYSSAPGYSAPGYFIVHSAGVSAVLPPGGASQTEAMKITSGICTTAGAETLCSMNETWPNPFVNSTYAYGCNYAGLPTGTGTNPGLYGPYVSSPTTTGFKVTIQAGSNSAGGNNTISEIDCRGME
jgi:hypothetical protein